MQYAKYNVYLFSLFVFSVWCTLHGSVFNIILFLLLACHSKAVFSDPGECSYLMDQSHFLWASYCRLDWNVVLLCIICFAPTIQTTEL